MARIYRGQESCPIARTLDVIGPRWTVLILRDLQRGKTRYSELLESLGGIPSNLLSERLKQLEADGIVGRAFYSDHPPRAAYTLTEKGKALVPVFRAMYRWGTEWEPLEEAVAAPAAAR